jgi:predicted RNase H-like nuclease (RuvC/YqgF family)
LKFVLVLYQFALLARREGEGRERAQVTHPLPRIKTDINKKAITDLRGEIDNLKIQIHKVNLQIEDTLRENNTLKRMCENREAEITSLVTANRELEKSN